MSNNIENKDLGFLIQDNFLPYAKYVIEDRALPNIKDGLKNVNRRILYTMYEKNMFNNKSTIKCANIVGMSMLLHPHGQ